MKKILISIFCAIIVCILGIFGISKYVQKDGENKLHEANLVVNTNEDYQYMEYQGKKYQYREECINILCIGVDKEERMSEKDDDGGSLGQADAILLVSIDTAENKIRVIAIPRDTMVILKQYDDKNNLIASWEGQITLQYACGDGQEESSLLVAEQVAKILHNIPMNGFASINLSCIPIINDAVGGVKLTMDNDYTLFNPEFEKGATVHLQGEAAKNFVQGRDIQVAGSAYDRIGRQKQYLKAFMEQAKKAVKTYPLLPIQLLRELDDNMITDCTYSEIFYLATIIKNCGFSEEELHILPGEITSGNVYEEYYLDEEAVTKLIVDLFYEEQ